MKRLFVDKVAWITGGGSGIGRATALELAAHGAKVAVSGRRIDRLHEVMVDLRAAGAEATAIACDVCDDRQVEAAVEAVAKHFGRVDVAIANAGFSVAGRVTEISGDEWRRQLETNVVGVALTARYALPRLHETGGRLGLIGSVAGFIFAPKLAAYNASKAAVRALGSTLSVELHGSGVSCTTIHPGFVASEIARVDNAGHFDPSRKDRRPRNLMWTAEHAAQVVVKSLYKRKREVVFSAHGKVGAFIGQHLPGVAHMVMTRGKP